MLLDNWTSYCVRASLKHFLTEQNLLFCTEKWPLERAWIKVKERVQKSWLFKIAFFVESFSFLVYKSVSPFSTIDVTDLMISSTYIKILSDSQIAIKALHKPTKNLILSVNCVRACGVSIGIDLNFPHVDVCIHVSHNRVGNINQSKTNQLRWNNTWRHLK